MKAKVLEFWVQLNIECWNEPYYKVSNQGVLKRKASEKGIEI